MSAITDPPPARATPDDDRWGTTIEAPPTASGPTRSVGTSCLVLAGALALVVYCFARYRDALLTFYFLDDFWVLRDAARIDLRSPWGFVEIFRPGHAGFVLYRPLTTVGYSRLLQGLFGFDASGHHAFQLAVFIVNSILASVVVRRLTGSLAAGAAAGFLYALAPGQAVNVYWLAAFTVTGTTLLLLLLCWVWLRTNPGPRRAALATALQALGLLASEHAVVWPALVLILGRLAPRRESWRRLAADIAPAALLVAAYLVAKVWYLSRVRGAGPYTPTVDVRSLLVQLGQYVVTCSNGVTLLAPGEVTCLAIGLGLVAVLGVSAWVARRRAGAWLWVAGGLAFFVVSLLPVLILNAHYYNHYVAPAALGAILATFGVCRLMMPRWWQTLAVALAVSVVAIDLATEGSAWRDDKIHKLVVRSADGSALWLQEVQRAAMGTENGPVHVPRNTVTRTLFEVGQIQTFFPATPRVVTLYAPEEPPVPAPGRFVLRPTLFGRARIPYPGWEPRWNWLRELARWGSGP